MDVTAAPTSSSSLLAGLPAAALVLPALLQQLPTGVVYYLPVYAADGSRVLDFRFGYLNPAAQRMLGLPAQPATTYLTQFPGSVASGAFAFHRNAFGAGGTLATFEQFYQADGYDKGIRAQACRVDAGLLVSFTDAEDQPCTVVEIALRAAQASERAARAEAQAQRQRLAEILRHLPAQVAVYHGSDHVYTSVNQRYQDYFPGQELLGHPVREAMSAAAGQGFFDLLDRVYQTGEPYYGIELPVNLNFSTSGRGQQVFINTCYHPLRNPQGVIEGVLDFSYDVTEQVRARQQVQQFNQDLEKRIAAATQAALVLQAEVLAATQRQVQERETFYQVFAQTPAAISLTHGPAHHYVFVNAGYQALFPDRVFAGQTVAEALPETRDNGLLARLDRVYHTGEPFFGNEVPFLMQGPGGTSRQAYYTLTSQAYREQGAIAGISTFAFEVTDLVRARQQREAGLAQLHTIFEQTPVGVVQLTGPDYVVEVANPAICAIWGRERAAVLGQPLFAVLPEIVDQGIPALLDEVRRTGEPFIGEELPLQLLRYGHPEIVYFQFVYQPLTDTQGQVSAVTVVATDVSAQVLNRQQLAQANEALRLTNAQLLRTNTDLDNFIYTASHDLKAPIANIEGLLLLLRKQLPPAVQQAGPLPRILGLMQESVERFRLTIAQLTDLTHLQQVRQEPTQAVALATVVEAVCLDLAPLLEATGGHLAVDSSACATVHFAPQHLRSIVYNLLSNALKYRQPDRVPHVHLRCRVVDNTTVLEVQDNGLGLSESQVAKLFRLFQRLHTHVEGSGVGLYMVKRIVENAGGTITVHSALGVGSTFTVTLPA